ncbi:MAG: hypothetical protein KGI25_00050 [Thaumarchaeota archaeon]|nr:hypothetical protein [Nitrososphaerota archaeon]
MATNLTAKAYRKVRVAPKDEAKMIDTLLKTGEQFKAVSKNDYYITTKQCATLSRNKIPYQKL